MHGSKIPDWEKISSNLGLEQQPLGKRARHIHSMITNYFNLQRFKTKAGNGSNSHDLEAKSS